MKTNNTQFQKSIVCAALISAFSSTAVIASEQTSAEELERITVTANRAPSNIDSVLANHVVISREEIELIQPHSVVDLLRTVAGINVSTQGGRGQNATVFLRGSNANHTLVLVDGIRVSSASLGYSDIQSISPEMVERVEIVKGPRAALWGSEAIGGVIQIFTRKHKSGSVNVNVMAGSEGFQNFSAGGAIAHGEGHTSVAVSHEKSDGFDVKKDEETDKDGYELSSFSLKGQQKITKRFTLDWLAKADEGDNEYDSAFGANESSRANHVWALRGTFDLTSNDFSNTTFITIGQNRDSGESYGNGIEKGQGSKFETRRDQFNLLSHYQIGDDIEVNFGLDLYKESLKGTTDYLEDSRNVNAIFIHGVYHYQNFTFDGAVRTDDVDGIDAENTFNAGAGYQIDTDTQIIFNIGSGFKAPTFNDLYWPASPWSGGNPLLVSETSDTMELLLKTEIQNVGLGLSTYRSDVDNLIEWAPDENSFWQPQNIAQVEITGVEFSASYENEYGTHQFNALNIKAENKLTGDQLLRRPQHQVNYKYSHQFDELNVYLEYQYRGKSNDNSPITFSEVELSSYHLVNVAANYTVDSNWTVNAKVNNLLDEEYETASAYNTQGASFYLGVSFNM